MSSPRALGEGQTLLDSEMGQLLATTQEIAVIAPRVALALRPGIGEWRCTFVAELQTVPCCALTLMPAWSRL